MCKTTVFVNIFVRYVHAMNNGEERAVNEMADHVHCGNPELARAEDASIALTDFLCDEIKASADEVVFLQQISKPLIEMLRQAVEASAPGVLELYDEKLADLAPDGYPTRLS